MGSESIQSYHKVVVSHMTNSTIPTPQMSTSKHITPQEDSIFIDFASFQIQFLEELL